MKHRRAILASDASDIDFWPKICATQSKWLSNKKFLKLLEQKLNLGKLLMLTAEQLGMVH